MELLIIIWLICRARRRRRELEALKAQIAMPIAAPAETVRQPVPALPADPEPVSLFARSEAIEQQRLGSR